MPTREARAPLPRLGLVTVRQRLDERGDVGLLGSLLYLCHGCARVTVGDVLGDGPVKEVDLLLNYANCLVQASLRDRAHVLPVNGDGAGVHVIEAREQRTGGGLAAAGRTHQGNGLAGANIQVKATDDLGVLARALAVPAVVRKVDVVVGDGALGHLERRRAGGVLNLGLGVDHLLETAEAGDGLLEGLGEVEDVLDGRGKERDVEGVGGKVCGLHLPLGDEPAAHDHDERIEDAHERGDACLVAAHCAIHAHLGVEVCLVALAELLALNVLGGKALDHTDAGKAVLQARVHVGDAHAVLAEDGLHLEVCPQVVDDENGENNAQTDGERHVDKRQDHKRAHDLDETNEQELGAVVGNLGDVEEVAHQAAHKVAGLVAVEEREAHALVGVKEVRAHAALHARTHDVAPVGHKVAATKAHGVHDDKAHEKVDEGGRDGIRALAEEAARERAEDLREGEVDAGDDDGADDVCDKEVHLSRIVAEKTSEEPAAAMRRGLG